MHTSELIKLAVFLLVILVIAGGLLAVDAGIWRRHSQAKMGKRTGAERRAETDGVNE